MTEANVETIISQAGTLKLDELRRLEFEAMKRFHRARKDAEFAEWADDADEFYEAVTRADMARRLADMYSQEARDLLRQYAEGWVV